MIRKLSASGFIALMALILAFQHTVLGYCGCSHDFFLADCQCASSAEDRCSCSHEICERSPSEDSEKAPCQDCCQKISYNSGDILWAPPVEPEAFTGAEIVLHPQVETFSFSQASVSYSLIAPQRPPPDSCPLFLRLGVMLL